MAYAFEDLYAMDACILPETCNNCSTLNDCITSMYIPGLECAFADNQKGVALLRINSPDSNITSVIIRHVGSTALSVILHLKAGTTFDEHDAFFNMLNVEITVSSGKTLKIDPIELVFNSQKEFTNHYWKNLFAEHSREFTPFVPYPIRQVLFMVPHVEDADITEVITSLFVILKVIRDDVDTKPARGLN